MCLKCGKLVHCDYANQELRAKMVYKVWIQIEEIDEEQDHYENVSEPECVGKFDTLAEAENLTVCIGIASQL